MPDLAGLLGQYQLSLDSIATVLPGTGRGAVDTDITVCVQMPNGARSTITARAITPCAPPAVTVFQTQDSRWYAVGTNVPYESIVSIVQNRRRRGSTAQQGQVVFLNSAGKWFLGGIGSPIDVFAGLTVPDSLALDDFSSLSSLWLSAPGNYLASVRLRLELIDSGGGDTFDTTAALVYNRSGTKGVIANTRGFRMAPIGCGMWLSFLDFPEWRIEGYHLIASDSSGGGSEAFSHPFSSYAIDLRQSEPVFVEGPPALATGSSSFAPETGTLTTNWAVEGENLLTIGGKKRPYSASVYSQITNDGAGTYRSIYDSALDIYHTFFVDATGDRAIVSHVVQGLEWDVNDPLLRIAVPDVSQSALILLEGNEERPLKCDFEFFIWFDEDIDFSGLSQGSTVIVHPAAFSGRISLGENVLESLPELPVQIHVSRTGQKPLVLEAEIVSVEHIPVYGVFYAGIQIAVRLTEVLLRIKSKREVAASHWAAYARAELVSSGAQPVGAVVSVTGSFLELVRRLGIGTSFGSSGGVVEDVYASMGRTWLWMRYQLELDRFTPRNFYFFNPVIGGRLDSRAEQGFYWAGNRIYIPIAMFYTKPAPDTTWVEVWEINPPTDEQPYYRITQSADLLQVDRPALIPATPGESLPPFVFPLNVNSFFSG